MIFFKYIRNNKGDFMICRYNRFNDWLKNKFGERTLKICIDGGFSCPNRDGAKLYLYEIEEGKYEYKKVGVIKPVANMIWDNRYMAKEECAPYSSLGKTTFVAVSGKDFVKGMLIREMSK